MYFTGNLPAYRKSIVSSARPSGSGSITPTSRSSKPICFERIQRNVRVNLPCCTDERIEYRERSWPCMALKHPVVILAWHGHQWRICCRATWTDRCSAERVTSLSHDVSTDQWELSLQAAVRSNTFKLETWTGLDLTSSGWAPSIGQTRYCGLFSSANHVDNRQAAHSFKTYCTMYYMAMSG